MQTTEPQFSQIHQTNADLSRLERIGLSGLAIALFIVLCAASILTPDPSGTGTHQQLGLPPCTMKYLLGIRCLGCGMTTSWAHTMNGEFRLAIASSLTGFILCLLAVLTVPVLVAFAVTAKVSHINTLSIGLTRLLIAMVSICVLEWLIRLAVG